MLLCTPKGLYPEAQGREAHPGKLSASEIVRVPQGALAEPRDPGLCYATPCMFRKPTNGGAGRVPLGRSSPTRSKDRPAASAPSQPEQASGTTPDSQGWAER